MQISAPPGILMQFSRSVKSSWAKALVNNYGKRKERLTPEFQTIWHLMRFSSAIGNLRSIRFRIISKMRNGNDDFSTSSIEQPNGSSQKHHPRTHSNIFQSLQIESSKNIHIAASHFADNSKFDGSGVAYGTREPHQVPNCLKFRHQYFFPFVKIID